ncbi:MAG: 1-deoxy-D-xylulose-5-phosphate reductoisomerase [Bacteroidota bacterium]|jgi:1-deoxy-D-xylulose-5-phosphate reductoisomerase
MTKPLHTEITPKRIAIMGSTGSIGTQALEVIKENPKKFEVEVLVAHSNADLLIKQAIEYKPNAVVIGDENNYERVKNALFTHDIKVYAGSKSIEQIVEMDTIDVVLASIVGYAGLSSTINAIKHNKTIALANKETLVVAGDIITNMAYDRGVNIYPVDSEHSAIFQCLVGEFDNAIEKIYLTASGGPFRGKDKNFLASIKKEQALKHPNWIMGAKITIDSASLMNKGLEVIEAKWLFNLKPNQIDVIVHPQSIVHSLVQFTDGSIKAQMGVPDMKLPIQYAFNYPQRVKNNFPRFDFLNYPNLTFEKADTETFTNLDLAYKAMEKGGNTPCVLNAANEVVVEAFLEDKIGFLQMSDVISSSIDKMPFIKTPSIDDYMQCDKETRLLTKELIKK